MLFSNILVMHKNDLLVVRTTCLSQAAMNWIPHSPKSYQISGAERYAVPFLINIVYIAWMV